MADILRLDPIYNVTVAGPYEGSWGQADALVERVVQITHELHDRDAYLEGAVGSDRVSGELGARGVLLSPTDIETLMTSLSNFTDWKMLRIRSNLIGLKLKLTIA